MFVGYFDDSGTHTASALAVVGGFIARPSEWLGFNHRWKEVLDKYGIEVHHQNKWSNGARPFNWNEWPDERRHAYINELIDVIVDREVITIGAAIPISRFDGWFPNHREFMSPFAYAAECLYANAARVIKQRVPDARIAYIFENGPHVGVQRLFNEHLKKPAVREKFGLISFTAADKHDYVQLQAADLIAYEIYKLYEKGDDPESINPRHPLKQIGDRITLGSWMTPSDEMIERTAQLATITVLRARLRDLGLQ